jgi:hypothetical protein
MVEHLPGSQGTPAKDRIDLIEIAGHIPWPA